MLPLLIRRMYFASFANSIYVSNLIFFVPAIRKCENIFANWHL